MTYTIELLNSDTTGMLHVGMIIALVAGVVLLILAILLNMKTVDGKLQNAKSGFILVFAAAAGILWFGLGFGSGWLYEDAAEEFTLKTGSPISAEELKAAVRMIEVEETKHSESSGSPSPSPTTDEYVKISDVGNTVTVQTPARIETTDGERYEIAYADPDENTRTRIELTITATEAAGSAEDDE